jgi:hypothetical protein
MAAWAVLSASLKHSYVGVAAGESTARVRDRYPYRYRAVPRATCDGTASVAAAVRAFRTTHIRLVVIQEVYKWDAGRRRVPGERARPAPRCTLPTGRIR